jgi:hypothetical protein
MEGYAGACHRAAPRADPLGQPAPRAEPRQAGDAPAEAAQARQEIPDRETRMKDAAK